MTAIHIDIDHASPPHSGTTFFDCSGACMRAKKTDTGLTVISISGEIDASNADDVSHRVSELASDCGALIVDLAEVDFIALDGLRALIALNIQCARTGTTWALIASHAVNRLFEWEITTRCFPPWDRRPRPYYWFADPAAATDHFSSLVHCSSLVRPASPHGERCSPATTCSPGGGPSSCRSMYH